MRDYTLDNSNYQEFQSLSELRQSTGQELHGLELDYDVFLNVRPPDPSRPHAIYESRGMDFRLRSGGAAVDAGCRLPNVNDEFTGSGPDLGALETGSPIPVYGPRK